MQSRSSRMVPYAPPSLVRFVRRAASVMTAPEVSTPTSDQVPEET